MCFNVYVHNSLLKVGRVNLASGFAFGNSITQDLNYVKAFSTLGAEKHLQISGRDFVQVDETFFSWFLHKFSAVYLDQFHSFNDMLFEVVFRLFRSLRR